MIRVRDQDAFVSENDRLVGQKEFDVAQSFRIEQVLVHFQPRRYVDIFEIRVSQMRRAYLRRRIVREGFDEIFHAADTRIVGEDDHLHRVHGVDR